MISDQKNSFSVFIVFGILAAIAYYFTLFNLGENLDKSIENRTGVLESEKKSVEEARKVAGDRPRFEREANKVGRQLQAAVKFLPATLEFSNVLSLLSTHAGFSGIQIGAINPIGDGNGVVSKSGFYRELPHNIVLSGEYQKIVQFLSLISNAKRILKFQDMTLRASGLVDQRPIISLGGVLTAYRYVEPKPEENKEESKTEEGAG